MSTVADVFCFEILTKKSIIKFKNPLYCLTYVDKFYFPY